MMKRKKNSVLNDKYLNTPFVSLCFDPEHCLCFFYLFQFLNTCKPHSRRPLNNISLHTCRNTHTVIKQGTEEFYFDNSLALEHYMPEMPIIACRKMQKNSIHNMLVGYGYVT